MNFNHRAAFACEQHTKKLRNFTSRLPIKQGQGSTREIADWIVRAWLRIRAPLYLLRGLIKATVHCGKQEARGGISLINSKDRKKKQKAGSRLAVCHMCKHRDDERVHGGNRCVSGTAGCLYKHHTPKLAEMENWPLQFWSPATRRNKSFEYKHCRENIFRHRPTWDIWL